MDADANGDVVSQKIEPGRNELVLGSFLEGDVQATTFYIPAKSLRVGENILTLSITEGQWVVYDYIRFDAVADASRPILKDFKATVPPFLSPRRQGFRARRAAGLRGDRSRPWK